MNQILLSLAQFIYSHTFLKPIAFLSYTATSVAVNTTEAYQSSNQESSSTFYERISLPETGLTILLALSITLTAIIGFLIYQRNLSNKKYKRIISEKNSLIKKQKAIINKARLELEIRMLKAQLNPELVRNSLHSIQEFIKEKNTRDALTYLTDFSTLLTNVLPSTIKLHNTLDEEISLLKSYIEMETTRYNGSFSYEFDVHTNLDSSTIRVPTLLLQPLVEYVLHQGLSAEHKKNLKVTFEEIDDLILCRIRDYVIGNQSAEKLNGTKTDQGKSHSVAVSEQRIRLIAMKYKVKARIEYKNMLNDQGEATGRSVNIYLPKIEHG